MSAEGRAFEEVNRLVTENIKLAQYFAQKYAWALGAENRRAPDIRAFEWRDGRAVGFGHLAAVLRQPELPAVTAAGSGTVWFPRGIIPLARRMVKAKLGSCRSAQALIRI